MYEILNIYMEIDGKIIRDEIMSFPLFSRQKLGLVF